MATQAERLKDLEDQLEEVTDYLFKHVLTPMDENAKVIKKRRLKR